jgi:NADH-quinone oxidoreductase subunit A
MSELQTGAVIGIYAIIILSIIGTMLVLAKLFGGYHPDAEKETPFECGIPPSGDARVPVWRAYYRVAVSFLIFELETAFLFAWAVAYWELGTGGVISAGIFIGFLLLGLVYEWRKGDLSWSPDDKVL